MSVPLRFRPTLDASELTKSLHTQKRKDVIPVVYKLAGEVKQIDNFMNDKELKSDSDKLELNITIHY